MIVEHVLHEEACAEPAFTDVTKVNAPIGQLVARESPGLHLIVVQPVIVEVEGQVAGQNLDLRGKVRCDVERIFRLRQGHLHRREGCHGGDAVDLLRQIGATGREHHARGRRQGAFDLDAWLRAGAL